jgi:hypothetical protein
MLRSSKWICFRLSGSREVRFAEDFGGKSLNLRSRIFPGVLGKSRFHTGFFEKSFSIPMELRGNLR